MPFGAFSSDQEMLAVLFLFQRKENVSLIKCIWLSCVSVANRDVPNCLKIIWVISKSLFLPVCRQFLVFVVCHISFPLAAYSLISRRAHSFVSCKMMPCLISRFFFFSPPCLSCRVYTLLHLGNFPQKSVTIKKRKYFFFPFKFAYSASS